MHTWIKRVARAAGFGSDKRAGAGRAIVEVLEDRRLMCAAAADVAVSDDTATMAATTASLRRVAVPNVVGKYTGKVATFVTTQLGSFPGPKFNATLTIKSQTGSKIKGTISVSGVGITNFSLTGTVASNGTFTAAFSKNGYNGMLHGHKTSTGLTGDFAAAGGGHDVSGTFSFKKVP